MSTNAIATLMGTLVNLIDEHQADVGHPLADDWESLALVTELDDKGDLATAYGFAYGPDDSWTEAISVNPKLVANDLETFLNQRYPDGQERPVKLLFQLRLTDGTYAVAYEDTDRGRWAVSPTTADQVREELRPSFDD